MWRSLRIRSVMGPLRFGNVFALMTIGTVAPVSARIVPRSKELAKWFVFDIPSLEILVKIILSLVVSILMAAGCAAPKVHKGADLNLEAKMATPPDPTIKIDKVMANEVDPKEIQVIVEWDDGLKLVLDAMMERVPPATLVAYENGKENKIPIFEGYKEDACEEIDANAVTIAPGLVAIKFACISWGDNRYVDESIIIYEFDKKPTSFSMLRQRWAGQGTTSSIGYYSDEETTVTFRVEDNKVFADRVFREGNQTGEAFDEAEAAGVEFVPDEPVFTKSSELLFERK
jgi:hypothetical protein